MLDELIRPANTQSPAAVSAQAGSALLTIAEPNPPDLHMIFKGDKRGYAIAHSARSLPDPSGFTKRGLMTAAEKPSIDQVARGQLLGHRNHRPKPEDSHIGILTRPRASTLRLYPSRSAARAVPCAQRPPPRRADIESHEGPGMCNDRSQQHVRQFILVLWRHHHNLRDMPRRYPISNTGHDASAHRLQKAQPGPCRRPPAASAGIRHAQWDRRRAAGKSSRSRTPA